MKLIKLQVIAVLLGFALGQAAALRAGPVFINEVLANNATVQDIAGGTPDWIELYNSSAGDVDLAGMSLGNNPNQPRRWVFPQGSVLRGGRYLVIYFDDAAAASARNTGYGLAASGDAVYLFDAAANPVDTVAFGLQIPDFSIGRMQVEGGKWSLTYPSMGAANEAVTLGNPYGLRINEWMADPASGNDWFELCNPDAKPVELSGLYLSNSLKKNPYKYRIPDLSFIGVGSQAFQKFVADDSAASGPNHVNFKLAKAGDELGIFPWGGQAIDSVTFGAQAYGVSQGRIPDAGTAIVQFFTTPTPEGSNYLPLNTVVINEILTHTDPPLEDAVELFNPTLAPIDISGWFLSDSPANFKKFQIPAGTTLSANGYRVFYEHEFTNSLAPFNFNSSEGDSVYLSQAGPDARLTGFRAVVAFGPAFNAVTFGRYTNSAGAIQYPPQITNTLGSVNSGPRVGPVVINEIMFHPPAVLSTNDNVQDEFIELFNLTAAPAPLYHPVELTNAWRIRGGVDYDFPLQVEIPAGGYLLVVSFNPFTNTVALDQFRQKYSVPLTVPIFGPYSGKLGNADDAVELRAPDYAQGIGHVNQGYVPYVMVDRVDYSSVGPWPVGAAATGYSLQKKNAFQYGNDPTNWFAALPTAGSIDTGGAVDLDADGLPNDWELSGQLNPLDASDAQADSDGDGLTNLAEYNAGTNPRDPSSVLRLAGVKREQGTIHLTFEAIIGRSYIIQYNQNLGNGEWLTLTNVNAVSVSGLMDIVDPYADGAGTRYYRLACP